MGGAGILAFGMLKRWRARGSAKDAKAKAAKGETPAADPKLDARLDAELRALDD
jgi:hypothetical protein